MMRALVTGAGGFVGRHLVAHLVGCGDEVIETDRATGGPDVIDAAAMAALVADAGPEVVFHLAGQADVAASWRDPVATLRANAEGTLAVLSACAGAGVGRVVVVTSAEVYGKVDAAAMPLGEDRPLDPVSPYAASKAAAEMVCVAWANQGLGVVRARAFNHLGPGQSEAFVAPAIAARLVRARRDGLDHISVGNLEARRDFTDVRDVVRAYRSLAIDGMTGRGLQRVFGPPSRDCGGGRVVDGADRSRMSSCGPIPRWHVRRTCRCWWAIRPRSERSAGGSPRSICRRRWPMSSRRSSRPRR